MKHLSAVIACATLLLAGCVQDQVSFGFGLGMQGYNGDIVRMGAGQRDILAAYLKDDYRRHCHAKVLPASCTRVKPSYKGARLPLDAQEHELPPDVARQLGFVPPGSAFVQAGYTVYLIRWPDKIIYDDVSYWKKESPVAGF